MRRALGLSVMLMLLCGAAYAQYSGTIRGTVTDPAGAVIAGADVSVVNTETAAARMTKSGGSGEYVFPDLPAGLYEIHVKQGTFKEFVAKGVELHGSSSAVVDVKLTMGSASELVTVEASALQVQTDSAQVGEVVNKEQVTELPLNGRVMTQLMLLQPGTSAVSGLNTNNKGLLTGSDISINGNPVTNNLWLLDGANNNDLGSNRTLLIYPSLDAIAEFKMVRNSYGPEYGQASGGVVSILTKSGTNQFHGSAYYFGRNDALNSLEFFAAQTGKKDPLRRHDYGYSIGGPIKKDKLFFFWSEEWNKEKRGTTRNSCVPTAAIRRGDFNAEWDAYVAAGNSTSATTCGQAPPQSVDEDGNVTQIRNIVTDAGALDPAGILIEDQFPLPNFTPSTPNGNNWFQSVKSGVNWRQELGRVDYNLTNRHTLTFRYAQDTWDNPAPNRQAYWGDDPYPALEGGWTQPSKSIIGKMTSVLGSTMTNTVQFSYSNNRINATLSGTGTEGNIDSAGNPASELSPSEYVAAINAAIPPNFPLPKVPGGIPPGSGWNPGIGYGATLWLIAPWNNSSDLYQFRDDLAKVYGTHTIKVGAFYGYNGKNEPNYGGQDQPGFGNNFKSVSNPITDAAQTSGNALADLLTPGAVFTSNENSANLFAHARWNDIEWYIQDNWKARRNLTLEYGFRWSLLMQPYAPNDIMSNWNSALYDPNGAPNDPCNGLVTVPGTDPCGDVNNLLGTTFSSGTPGRNRALVDNGYHNIAPRLGISWDPWSDGKTAVRVGVGQFYQRERVSTVTAVLGQNAPFSVSVGSVNRTLGTAPTLPSLGGSPSGARDTRPQIPNSWQWNLSVERELMRDTTLQVGYVGNRGLHLTSDFDANAPLPGTRVANALCRPGDPNPDNDCAVPGRPFSQTGFGGIDEFAHRGSSTYHSLQASFRTRFRNRSQIQAAYTWSHSLTIVDLSDSSGSGFQTHTTSDPFNPGLDKGNSRINRPQVFVANAVVYLPMFNGSQKAVQQVLGGWEASTVFTAESGNSVNIFPGGNLTDINGGGLGVPVTIGNPSGLGGVANNQLRLVQTGNCNSGTNRQHLFNQAAFTFVGYQFGTVGQTSPGSCLGPKMVNLDFSLYKNWKLTESLKLQFRMEAFNVLNHANFRPDNINTGWTTGDNTKVACGDAPCSPSNSVVTAMGPSGTASGNTNFGVPQASYGGREIQYALKFIF